jgi:hypothetical protein
MELAVRSNPARRGAGSNRPGLLDRPSEADMARPVQFAGHPWIKPTS